MTSKVGVENLKFDLKSVGLRCKQYLHLFYYHHTKIKMHQPKLADQWIISFIENGKFAYFSSKQNSFKINIHFERSKLAELTITKSNFIQTEILKAILDLFRNIDWYSCKGQ